MPTNTGYKPLEQFDWIILAVKFLKVLLPSQAAAILIENGNPDSVGGFLAMGDANIAAFVAAIIVAVLNVWKHRAKLGNGMSNFGLLLAMGAVAPLMFAGCATWTPAVGGKTRAETAFSDSVLPDGTQTTTYNRKVELPAGVDLAGADSMTYNWTEAGGGNIAINGDGTASTQGQAAMLPQVAAIQAQSIADALGALRDLTAILAPLVGAHIEAQANRPPAEPNPLLDAVIRGALRPGP